MSGAIDVNLLLYAEDESSPFHERALKFLNGLLEEGGAVYVTWDVLHAFLRIATHSNIFSNPLAPEDAVMDLEQLLDHASVAVLSPSTESWVILARLMRELHLRGNAIPDAVTASILESNGVRTIYTHDRDFSKFPGLNPIDPLID